MNINKGRIKWINFLHIYQPANADDDKINEATEKSYLRIVRGLEEHPNIKFTLNITGCLVLRWIETGNTDIIKRIKSLTKKGQVELTGSAAYHPLLPLVDIKEAKKQIKENEEILLKYFGVKPRGFFFPEMACGARVAKLVKEMGYEWIILDEISRNGKLEKNNVDMYNCEKRIQANKQDIKDFSPSVRNDKSEMAIDKNSGLKVIFRSREYSNSYVPEMLNNLTLSPLGKLRTGLPCNRRGNVLKDNEREEVIITGTDGELVGLRHEDPTAEFEKVLKSDKLETLTVSEFIKTKDNIRKERIVNSNWESTEKDLRKKQPYALWENSGNGIQKRIWKLAKLAYKTVEGNEKDNNYDWARWHLVRGLASCTFWWASGKDFSYIYGPYAWNPDEVERGLRELIRSIRSLDDRATRKVKMDSEKLYVRIKQMIWNKHWNEHWKR